MRIQLAKRFYNYYDQNSYIENDFIKHNVRQPKRYNNSCRFIYRLDDIICDVCVDIDGNLLNKEYYNSGGLEVGPEGWCRLRLENRLGMMTTARYTIKNKKSDKWEDTIVVINNIKQLGVDPRSVAEDWIYTYLAIGRDSLHFWVSPDKQQKVARTNKHFIYYISSGQNWIEQERVAK